MTLASTVKTQAHQLKASLAAQQINIRYTQALDLVCAVYGLRSRHLAAPDFQTNSKPNLVLLTKIATKLALHDQSRRQTIVNQTAAITHCSVPNSNDPPSEPQINLTAMLGNATRNQAPTEIILPASSFASTDTFLNTPIGQSCIEKLASHYAYYRYYQDQRGPMGRRYANELGQNILKAVQDPDEDPLYTLESYFDHGQDPMECIHQQGSEPISDFVDELMEALGEHPSVLTTFDETDWTDDITQAIADFLGENDETSALDMIGDFDRCEVVFAFGTSSYGLEDDMLTSHKPWSDPSELAITPELQHVMASLGYTVGEYRALAENKHPSWKRLTPIQRRRPPVAPWPKIAELISEACAQYFNVVLYALVPIKDLVHLKTGADLHITGAHLASYNCMNGTFYDSVKIEDITVSASEGTLHSCHGWYTPDDICGLVTSSYHGNVKNAAANEET